MAVVVNQLAHIKVLYPSLRLMTALRKRKEK